MIPCEGDNFWTFGILHETWTVYLSSTCIGLGLFKNFWPSRSNWPSNFRNVCFKLTHFYLYSWTVYWAFTCFRRVGDESGDHDLDLQGQICHESSNVCVIPCERGNLWIILNFSSRLRCVLSTKGLSWVKKSGDLELQCQFGLQTWTVLMIFRSQTNLKTGALDHKILDHKIFINVVYLYQMNTHHYNFL